MDVGGSYGAIDDACSSKFFELLLGSILRQTWHANTGPCTSLDLFEPPRRLHTSIHEH
jgi:hypothetical protein